MHKISFVDFFSESYFMQLKQYTNFVFVQNEPSIFVARLLREHLQKALSIDHLVSCKDDWYNDQSFFVDTFFSLKTIWWKSYPFEGMTKKDSGMYQLFFSQSRTNRIFFCMLSPLDLEAFDFSVAPSTLFISNENITEVEALLFLQKTLNLSLPKEKLQVILDCFSKKDTLSLDVLYAGLSYFSLIPSRHLLRTRDLFLEQWILNRSLFELLEKLVIFDYNAFFLYWDQLQDTESYSFWISFWSDLFWKFYFYVKHPFVHGIIKNRQEKEHLDKKVYEIFSKKAAKVKESSILTALERLYSMDDRMKRSGQEVSFDFLFLDFFLNNERVSGRY